MPRLTRCAQVLVAALFWVHSALGTGGGNTAEAQQPADTQ